MMGHSFLRKHVIHKVVLWMACCVLLFLTGCELHSESSADTRSIASIAHHIRFVEQDDIPILQGIDDQTILERAESIKSQQRPNPTNNSNSSFSISGRDTREVLPELRLPTYLPSEFSINDLKVQVLQLRDPSTQKDTLVPGEIHIRGSERHSLVLRVSVAAKELTIPVGAGSVTEVPISNSQVGYHIDGHWKLSFDSEMKSVTFRGWKVGEQEQFVFEKDGILYSIIVISLDPSPPSIPVEELVNVAQSWIEAVEMD